MESHVPFCKYVIAFCLGLGSVKSNDAQIKKQVDEKINMIYSKFVQE